MVDYLTFEMRLIVIKITRPLLWLFKRKICHAMGLIRDFQNNYNFTNNCDQFKKIEILVNEAVVKTNVSSHT